MREGKHKTVPQCNGTNQHTDAQGLGEPSAHPCPHGRALLAFRHVRVLLDYRPALRNRSGVGEYVHELAGALASTAPPDHRLELFTSSWKDRLQPHLATDAPGVTVHDRRVPVRVLNWWWHRAGVPRVERLVPGPFDVVHAAHPLLIPARAARCGDDSRSGLPRSPRAHARAEVRRDYPLPRAEARTAAPTASSPRRNTRRSGSSRRCPFPASTLWSRRRVRHAGRPAAGVTPRNPAGYVLVRGHARAAEEPGRPAGRLRHPARAGKRHPAAQGSGSRPVHQRPRGSAA